MSKYAPLTTHLKCQTSDVVAMSFADIARLLGFSLPPSSRRYRPWWSNNPTSHAQARAWLDAGFRSLEVDMEGQALEFIGLNAAAEKLPRRHPLFGAMKGLGTVAEGVDLTDAMFTDDDWADIETGMWAPVAQAVPS